MPLPHAPAFELVPSLIGDALSICVVVAAVHISLAKMFSKRLHYAIDAGQEFYALGFTSMLASFFPIYPISTSLGRTVVNVDAGSKTQVRRRGRERKCKHNSRARACSSPPPSRAPSFSASSSTLVSFCAHCRW